ncbi:NAD(+) diphosphatase [Opitutaceae bacterium EW11]|nr:NAD(+) diphosphatase [Opitutaceae bacterium EW11]
MSFVHHHAPHAKPGPGDVCLAIHADRLLARPDVSQAAQLPCCGDISGLAEDHAPPLLHVGALDGRACWLRAVGGSEAPALAGWEWHDTRALLGVFTPAQSHAVSCARQLLWWDRRHRFCGVCGTATVEVVEERARRCPQCGALYFPAVSPAVIVAVTRGDELLLAHNRNFRPGMFSLLAGFVDPGETLEQAVVREVSEEVSIRVNNLRYISSQPWPFPNSLMLGFRATHADGEIEVDGKEIEQAGWFKRTALPDIPRPGTVARQLIDAWLRE